MRNTLEAAPDPSVGPGSTAVAASTRVYPPAGGQAITPKRSGAHI